MVSGTKNWTVPSVTSIEIKKIPQNQFEFDQMLTKFRFYSRNMNWTKKLRLFNELGRILSGNVHQSVSQIVKRTHQKEHIVVRNPFGQFWRVSVSVFQLKLKFKWILCTCFHYSGHATAIRSKLWNNWHSNIDIKPSPSTWRRDSFGNAMKRLFRRDFCYLFRWDLHHFNLKGELLIMFVSSSLSTHSIQLKQLN